MIHAEKLIYEYDKRDEEGNVIGTNRAIDGVDIDIPQGSFVAVLGHNGSGKSTLINNLSTIDTPTKGKVKINGIDVYSMLESQTGKFRYENLGFIFQSFNLMDTLTLKENIALPLTLSNMSKEEIGISVQQTAERLELCFYTQFICIWKHFIFS